MKIEPTIWETIFVYDTSDKGLISKYRKNYSHVSTPGGQTIQLKKNGQRTWTDTSLCGHKEGPETYDKMLSTTSPQRDAN